MHYIRPDAENAATLRYVRWSYSNILFSFFRLSYADVCFLHSAAVSHDQPPWQKSQCPPEAVSFHSSSVCLCSQALLMLLAVSLTVFAGFFSPSAVSQWIFSCDLLFLHRGRVSLALVLQLIIWSMVMDLMCDWVCLYLPQFSGWNCAPDLSENTISKLLCPEFADNEEGPSTIAGLSFN